MSESRILSELSKRGGWRKGKPPLEITPGSRWQMLVAIRRIANTSRWECVCDCGKEVVSTASNLRDPRTMSCGCYRNAKLRSESLKHGMHSTPEYVAFASAKGRCRNPNNAHFADYGGRNIEFRFTSFEEFLVHMGHKPTPKHSLDRIDVNGHYEKGNLRWATWSEQENNKRNTRWLDLDGRRQSLTEWAMETGVKRNTIAERLFRGWCVRCAVYLPTGSLRTKSCEACSQSKEMQ